MCVAELGAILGLTTGSFKEKGLSILEKERKRTGQFRIQRGKSQWENWKD